MKKRNYSFLLGLFAALLITTNVGLAQVSGTKTVAASGGDYTTLAAAISDLNTNGVGAGGVIINVPAGWTETLSSPIVMTATGTSSNTIVIQKSGTGANPVLTTGYAGTITLSGTSITLDGIWAFSGSDYVTIDGIDLVDNNTVAAAANSLFPQLMEYGYGFFKTSATNGCQNNTIKNSAVSLNRLNAVAGFGFNGNILNGSSGILMLPTAINAVSTTITVTSVAGENANNKFYTNTISNCNQGIAIYGYADASPYTLNDTGNDIGGNSLSTGNTIINFGGVSSNYFAASTAVTAGYVFSTNAGNVYRVSSAGTLGTTAPSGTTTGAAITNGTATVYFLFAITPTNGVIANNQDNFNVSYNTINNNNGSGIPNIANNIRGINLGQGFNSSVSITNNTIVLKTRTVSSGATCIENSSGGSSTTLGTSNTVNISNNNLTLNGDLGLSAAASTFTVNPTGSHFFINNNGYPYNLTISGNTVNNASYCNNTSGTFNHIYSAGYGVNNNNFTGNTVGNISFPSATAFTGSTYYLYLAGGTGATNATLNFSNNTIQAVTYTTVATTGINYLFYPTGVFGAVTVNNNRSNNLTLNSSGTTYFLYENTSAQTSKVVTNNGITGTFSRGSGASGTLYLLYQGGSTLGSASYSVYNNVFNGITSTIAGTGGIYLMYNLDYSTTPYPRKQIYNNIFSNINYNSTGLAYLMYMSGSGDNGAATGSAYYGNVFSTITLGSAGSGGTVYGLYPTGTTSGTAPVQFYGNTLNGITTNGATNYFCYLGSGTIGLNFYNNKLYNLTANNAAALSYGLYTLSSNPYNIYNNIIGDISAPASSLTAPTPSVAGMFLNSGSTVNVYNNTIFIPSSTTSTGTNFGTAGIYTTTTVTSVNLRNNLVINNSVPKGTGRAVAFQRSGVGFANMALTSNKNIWYAGTPSANNLIMFDGTNAHQTILAYRVAAAVFDQNAGTENTAFLSTVGSNVNYLHVDGATASFTEGNADPITLVNTDFDGANRNASTPDVGADEYAGIAIAPPAAPINFGSNTVTTTSFNITWDDNSVGEYGFIISRSTSLAGPYTAIATVPSTTVGTTGTSYSLAQTSLLGNTTYYYQVVAAAMQNSSALPGTASTAACGAGLSGTYTIAPTGANYQTLTQAITALNTNGMAGSVVLELQPTYVSTSETFPIAITNSISCLGATNRLTIRPAASVSSPLTITSTSTTATINISGANYVTIDGRPGGTGTNKFLIVENTSTTAAAAGNAIQILNESSNNNLTYLDIKSANQNPANSTLTPAVGNVPGAVAIMSTTGSFGNDNDTISYCNIHSAASGALNVGVYSYNATSAGALSNNDNNVIINNNIYDWFSAASASAGVNIASGCNNYTISNNSIYMVGTKTYTGTQTVRAMWITPNTGSLTSASGFIINGNSIGGQAPSCGGAAMNLTGAFAWLFNGMDLSLGSGLASSVQGNTIANITMSTTSTSTTALVGIGVANGITNIGNISANTFGSTTVAGSINFTTTSSLGGVMAYRIGGGSIHNLSNNIVSGVTLNGNATTVAPSFTGIAVAGGTTVTVNNNTIGGSLANSINIATTSSTATSAPGWRGIHVTGGTTNTVTNNTISNMTSSATGTTGFTGTMQGIYVTASSCTVSNNSINNLRSATVGANGGSTAGLIGIAYNSTTAPATVSSNTIHTLILTNATATASTTNQAISYGGPTSGVNVIEKNFIHSISLASTSNASAVISGMDIGSGLVIIRNNMIRLGLDETGASIVAPCLIRGITENSATSSIYHNTIYIAGSNVNSATTNNTFALVRTGSQAATPNDDWRNNILFNNRSNATTGQKHYAINLSSTGFLTLNNNVYAGSGTGYVFGASGATDFASYANNWVTGDASSWAYTPNFVNANGNASAIDLHIDATQASIVESTGANIASVGDDFDGQTRSGLTPSDIGADAGNFISLLCSGTPTPGTVLSNTRPSCNSGTATLLLTGATSTPGITFQWMESAVSGGPYTNVTGGTGATTSSYVTPTLTASKFYICQVTCTNGGATANSTEDTAIVIAPTLVSTAGTTICGPFTALVSATPTSPYSVNWYAAATGGTTIATGNTYTTPLLSSNTTYYAVATSGSTTNNLGLANRVSTSQNTGYNDIGLMFNALTPLTINSVNIYPVNSTPGTAATITIAVRDAAGTTIQSATISNINTTVSPGVKTLIPLNFTVPAGNGYRLVVTAATGLTGLTRESTTGFSYPYTIPGVASITSAYTSGASSSFYYYFYDWIISTGCESSRSAVNVVYNTPPTLTTTNSLLLCNGQAGTISVTSNTSDFDSYVWTPTANLYQDLACTIPYTSAVTSLSTVYYLNSAASQTSVICSATNSVTGCSNRDTTGVFVGLSGTVSTTQITGCSNPTGLINANVSGAGTVVNNDFSSATLPSNMVSAGNDFAITGGRMQLTSAQLNKNGGVIITNTTGLANNDFQIDFDFITVSNGGAAADGFSYSYGDDVVALPSATAAAGTTGVATLAPENGSGTKLKLSFDAINNTGGCTGTTPASNASGNTSGIYLMYNSTTSHQGPTCSGVIYHDGGPSGGLFVNGSSSSAGTAAGLAWRASGLTGTTVSTHVTITINSIGEVSMWLNNIQVVANQQLPASYLTANKANWKHAFSARTGGSAEGHYVDNLVIQYNNVYEYSINNGTSWTTTTPIVAPGPGTYNVDVRYAAVPSCSISLGTATINNPTFTAVTNNASVCNYSPSMPTLGFSPNFVADSYQWISSANTSNTYTAITGATSTTYLPTTFPNTTNYRLQLNCGTVTPVTFYTTDSVKVVLDNPTVLTSGQSVTPCGLGTATLDATTQAGYNLYWYNSPTSFNPLGTGSSFTTPVLSATTTYYVASGTTGGTTQVSNNGLPNTFTTTQNAGLIFDLNVPVTLNSIQVYANAAGNVTVAVWNSTMTTNLFTSTPQAVTAAGLTSPFTINLGWAIPAGTGYRILVSNTGNSTGYASGTFPISLGNGVGTIVNGAATGGLSTTSLNYFVYSMNTTAGCLSPKTAVTATVTTAPSITVSNSRPVMCAGSNDTLGVSSTNSAYTYSWMPGSLNGATQIVSPTPTTTVQTSNVYTVTASDASTGCSTQATTTVTVNPNPSAVAVTPNAPHMLLGTPQQLTASGGTNGFSTTATLGVGTSTSTTSSVTPFGTLWEGSRKQYLITPAELNALGLTAGNISSIGFNVSSVGSYAMSNFTIKMATTSATSAAAIMSPIGSYTTCYGPTTFTAPVLGWNTFTFTTPFYWNGTDNVIVDICHDNDINNTCSSCYGSASGVYYSTTSYVSTWGQYDDNIQSCGTSAATYQYSYSYRPNMTFGYSSFNANPFYWSPAQSLYMNATASTPYSAGGAANTVYANPRLDSVYTITARNLTTGCTTSTTDTVYVDQPPVNYDCANASTLSITAACNYTAGTSKNGWYNPAAIPTTPATPTTATCGNADDDVWYTFTRPAGMTSVVFTVVGSSNYDPAFEIVTGACGGTQTVVACVNNTSLTNNATETYTLLVPSGAAANTYYLRIYDARTGYGSGNFNVCLAGVVPPPMNNNPCGAANFSTNTANWGGSSTVFSSYDGGAPIFMGLSNNVTSNPPIGVNCVYFTGTTAYANNLGGNEPTPPCGNLGSNAKTVWFKFKAPTIGGVDVTLRSLFNGNPTNFSNLIAAYVASVDPCTGTPTYTNLACATTGVLSLTAASTILAPYAGQDIYVQLAGNGASSPVGNYMLSIQAVPQNIALSNPTTSSLTVTLPTAPGATNVTVQWRAVGSTGYSLTNLSPSVGTYTINGLTSGVNYQVWAKYSNTSQAFYTNFATLGTTIGCSASPAAPTVTPVPNRCSRDTISWLAHPLASTSFPYRLYWKQSVSSGYSVLAVPASAYNASTGKVSVLLTNLLVNTSYQFYYRVICAGGAQVVSGIANYTQCNGPAKMDGTFYGSFEHNGRYFVDADFVDVTSFTDNTPADGNVHEVVLNEVNDMNAVLSGAGVKVASNGEENGAFELIPNPTSDNVFVEYKVANAGRVVVRVMNIQGKVVKEEVMENSDASGAVQIDLSDVQSGVYMVSVDAPGYKATKRLVVTK